MDTGCHHGRVGRGGAHVCRTHASLSCGSCTIICLEEAEKHIGTHITFSTDNSYCCAPSIACCATMYQRMVHTLLLHHMESAAHMMLRSVTSGSLEHCCLLL